MHDENNNFFDVDNTLYNNTTGAIPDQTRKLLFELSAKEDILLGLATGRGKAKLEIIKDVLPLFTYKVLVNGAYVLKDDHVVFDHPIATRDVLEVLELIKGTELNVGMVGIDDEAVSSINETVNKGMKTLRGHYPKVNPKFHLEYPIYQLWMFAESESQILDMATNMTKFRVYPWHKGGADFVYPEINKGIWHSKSTGK